MKNEQISPCTHGRKDDLIFRTAACFLLTGCLAFAHPIDVEASSVDTMIIEVSLQEDGSAVVTQYWRDAYADEGTEYYLYYKDSGYLSFSDLTVSDSDQEYENIGAWDIDADFDEKAYCCGIHEVDDGVELCWGISEYGDNDFTISYTIENLVSAYEDADGIFYRFVNSLDLFPTDAVVIISMADGTPLTEENASIWAFGYDGDIVFNDDGTIHANTDSSLMGDENMTLLIELDPSLLSPSYTMEGTMEEVIDLALDDSDYIDATFGPEDYYSDSYEDGGDNGLDITFGVIFIAVAYAIYAGIKALFRAKADAKYRTFYESCGYFTGIPNGGNLDASYSLAKNNNLCEDGAAVSLYLMKMMISGAIRPVQHEGNTDQQDLLLFPEKTDDSVRQQKLMQLLMDAAQGNSRLTSMQLARYTGNHYERFDSFCTDCDEAGRRFLKSNDCLSGHKFRSFSDLNDRGRAQLAQLIGLQRYLHDMPENLSGNVNAPEISTDLLIYAILFDQLPQFLYYYRSSKDNAYNISNSYNDPMYYYFYFGNTSSYYGHEIHRQVSNGRAAAARAAAASGGGGSSSSGGGGGFSGGGGGGTR